MLRLAFARLRPALMVSIPAVAALFVGCSEPTGDAAYGQKFEKPAGAKDAPAESTNAYSERRAEIKKAQAEPATKSTKSKSK